MMFKNSDKQTNIDKYRVAGNITEYHSISKSHVKNVSKNVKNEHV